MGGSAFPVGIGTSAAQRWRVSADKPLCASLDGFTLHAATRAGALDTAGREALLRYVLRPPVAQERIEPQKDGLVAITLTRNGQGFVGSPWACRISVNR